MIKLVASDIDGTLLMAGEQSLRASVFDMIEKLHKKGIMFVAASGRPYCEMKELFRPVVDKMGFVCNDGAMTVIGQRIIDIQSIEPAMAKEALEDIHSRKNCEFLAYSINNAYAKPKSEEYAQMIKELLYGNDVIIDSVDEIDSPILKIALYNEFGIQDVENYFLATYTDKFEVTYAANQWLEFNRLGINKSVGILKFVEEMGISINDTMAFGDSYNDLEMLKVVHHSYAVETAKEEVKRMGKYICKDVENTIRKILL